jgi:hypothetical protein
MKEDKKFDTMMEVPSGKRHFVLAASGIVLTTVRWTTVANFSSLP